MSEMRQLAKEGADLRVKADSFREPMPPPSHDLDDAKGMSSASRPATEDPRAMESRGMRSTGSPTSSSSSPSPPSAGRAEHRSSIPPARDFSNGVATSAGNQ